MASFGFGMVSFFRSLRQQSPTAQAQRLHNAAIRFGLALIDLGILATTAAVASQRITLRRLRRGKGLCCQVGRGV